MDGSLARKLMALLLLTTLGNGCAAFRPVKGTPVQCIPADWLAVSRENTSTIDLSLLGQVPPSQHIVDRGDVLGIYIEGVLGEKGQAPPISAPVIPNDSPKIGYPLAVRDDGTISLPLIGAVDVTGMTVRQVEEHIRRIYTIDKEILQPGQDRIIVTLQKPRDIRVLVMRQENTNVLDSVQAGSVNLGTAKRGTGRIVSLPIYKNDVLHALAETGGLPGLDAENMIYVIRRSETQVQTKPSKTFQPSRKPAAEVKNNSHPVQLPDPEPVAVQQMSYEIPASPRQQRLQNPIQQMSYRSAPATSNYRAGAQPSNYRQVNPGANTQTGGTSPWQGYRSTHAGQSSVPMGNYRSGMAPQWPVVVHQDRPSHATEATAVHPPVRQTSKPASAVQQAVGKTTSATGSSLRGRQPRWKTNFVNNSKPVERTTKPPQPNSIAGMRPAVARKNVAQPVRQTPPRQVPAYQKPTDPAPVYQEPIARDPAPEPIPVTLAPATQPHGDSQQTASNTPTAATPHNTEPKVIAPFIPPPVDALPTTYSTPLEDHRPVVVQSPAAKQNMVAVPSLPQSGSGANATFANSFSMETLAAHPDLIHTYIDEPTIRSQSVIRIPVRLKPGQMPNITPDDVILQDGDIVFIESRETEIFYTGGLLGGGQYTLPRDYDLDILGAISLAQSNQNVGNQATRATGGVSAINGDVTISASDVVILRRLPHNEHVRIRVNLYKALRDPAERIQIMPGDMVILQYKPLEAVGAFIERHLLEGALFGVAAAQLNSN